MGAGQPDPARSVPRLFPGQAEDRRDGVPIIPDGNTLATQVQTHEIDVAWNLPPTQYARVKAAPGVTAIAPVVYIFDHLDFNLTRPLFGDVRVRRALTYAIDGRGCSTRSSAAWVSSPTRFMDPTLYKNAYDRP